MRIYTAEEIRKYPKLSGEFMLVDDVSAKYKRMEFAMQMFIERCECGEVRSKKTYAQFKEILGMP
jgi:hypothetical protein